jgi:hypothetical protein
MWRVDIEDTSELQYITPHSLAGGFVGSEVGEHACAIVLTTLEL